MYLLARAIITRYMTGMAPIIITHPDVKGTLLRMGAFSKEG
jgi:hypothetical protein